MRRTRLKLFLRALPFSLISSPIVVIYYGSWSVTTTPYVLKTSLMDPTFEYLVFSTVLSIIMTTFFVYIYLVEKEIKARKEKQ
jgi:hypothetical protein